MLFASYGHNIAWSDRLVIAVVILYVLGYIMSITAPLCTMTTPFSRLPALKSLLSVCAYHPPATQPQIRPDSYQQSALYKYIEKKLHTVYPMLYKPTLKNSKN